MSSSRRKRSVFVGGLDDRVTEELLHAAFIPFGDIKNVSIPRDFQRKEDKEDKNNSIDLNGTVRGYGFVEFEEEEDATAAIDNMNGAELFQRTINVYYARPMKQATNKAIWTEGPRVEDVQEFEVAEA
jgi:peptidyl-prolyl isomerase E (cyclophilin E)